MNETIQSFGTNRGGTRHYGGPLSIRADGQRVVVGCLNAAYVFDVESGEELAQLPAGALDLEYSPDGTLVAEARGGHVVVRDMDTLEVQRHIEVPSARYLAWHADGSLLAITGSEGSSVQLHDPGTGELVGVLPGAPPNIQNYSVRFSRDGSLVVSGATDGKVRVWCVSDRSLVAEIAHGSRIAHVALSPDNVHVVVGTYSRHAAKVYDVESGTEVRLFAEASIGEYAEFTPDGELLVGSDGGGRLSFWNTREWDYLGGIDAHDGRVRGLGCAMTPDGRLLATAGMDGELRLWDVASRTQLRAFGDLCPEIRMVEVSPDGSFVAAAQEYRGVTLFDPADGKTLATFRAHPRKSTRALAISADGARLAFDSDQDVHVYDVETRQRICVLRRGYRGTGIWWWTALGFGEQGETIAQFSGFDNRVCVWRLDGSLVQTFAIEDAGHCRYLCFSPDGKRFALITGQGEGRIYRLGRPSEREPRESPLLASFLPPSSGFLAFSPDNALLAMTSGDGFVHLYDTAAKAFIEPLQGPPYEGPGGWLDFRGRLAFSADGSVLAEGVGHRVRLWNFAARERIAETEMPGSMALRADGRMVATGDAAGLLRTWT